MLITSQVIRAVQSIFGTLVGRRHGWHQRRKLQYSQVAVKKKTLLELKMFRPTGLAHQARSYRKLCANPGLGKVFDTLLHLHRLYMKVYLGRALLAEASV